MRLLGELEMAIHIKLFISMDGKYVLGGGGAGQCSMWDINTGEEIRNFEGHTFSVNSVSFSDDGRYVLSGGTDRTVRLWDLEQDQEPGPSN